MVPVSFSFISSGAYITLLFYHLGVLARESYESRRRESAALKIQRNSLAYIARSIHIKTRLAVIVLQAGIRAMVARSEYRRRRQVNAAAIVIQVRSWMFTQLDQCFIALIILLSLRSDFLSNLFLFLSSPVLLASVFEV